MQLLGRWGLRLYGAIVAGILAGATATAWAPPELQTAIHLQQIMWPLVISALLFPAIVLCAFAVTTTGLAIYALGVVYIVPLWRRLARMGEPTR